jgi:hypothetical protein
MEERILIPIAPPKNWGRGWGEGSIKALKISK